MSPPEPVRCHGFGLGNPPCQYVTRQGLPTHQLISDDLHLHSSVCSARQRTEAASSRSGPRPQRLDRPEIGEEASEEDWRRFVTAWKRYKTSCQLSGEEASTQLYYCCTTDLQKILDGVGVESNCSEEELMKKIKEVAARKQNVLLNTVQFLNMKAGGESVVKFASRLNRKAMDCEFILPKGETDYSKKMVQFQLVSGLEDGDIQEQLLAEFAVRPKMTVEETIKFVEAKQMARKDVTHLTGSGGKEVNKVTEYQRTKNNRQDQDDKKDRERCKYCGWRGHGSKPDEKTRKEKCRAWDKECLKCGRKGHYMKRCESKKGEVRKVEKKESSSDDKDSDGESDEEVQEPLIGSVYGAGQFCKISVGQTSNGKAKLLSHHEWEDGRLVKRKPERHPELGVKVSVCREAYKQLNIKEPRREKKGNHTAESMPDTGAMMCLIGMSILHTMGLNESDLVEVEMKVNAANNRKIPLLGGIFMKVEFGGRVSKQLMYVTDEVHCIFLSKRACRDLGIIGQEFPMQVSKCTAIDDEDDNGETCTCPRRESPPPPPELPCPATPENVEKLENFVREYYASSAFNRCERQPLPVMNESPPCRLFVDPDAKPVALHKPRQVPVHWQEKVKKDLDRDVRMEVLEGPLMDDPAEWCAAMQIAAKKNGDPRRTVDFQGLNRACQRQTHAVKAPFHQCSAVPPGVYKTTLDAWNGYHSVRLAEEDRHLTTFLTPWGRYRYKNLPQGFLAAGDAYTARYDEITKDFKQMEKCVDDTLLWDRTLEENFKRTCEYLTHCNARGITFNEEKFKFGRREVEYLGFIITEDSVKPSSEFIAGIRDFPEPKDLSGVRSWFGLVNQVNYTLSDSTMMAPFKPLLSSKSKFEWTAELAEAFSKSKGEIIKAVEEGVRMFQLGKPTCLGTDWSRTGLGFVLTQKHCKCDTIKPDCCKGGWKIVFAGSRFTTGAESRYHPVEGEALSVAWGLHKTKYFTIGCRDLTLCVDHKPLVKILGNRELNDINNTRILNFKEKTLRWRFKIMHVPGSKHKVADAASRYPVVKPVGEKDWRPWEPRRKCKQVEDNLTSEEVEESMVASLGKQVREAMRGPGQVNAQGALDAIQWQRLDDASFRDSDIKELGKLVMDGVPEEVSSWPGNLQPYFVKDADYSVLNNVVIVNDRVVIPRELRGEILRALHIGHCGVTGMGNRAREVMYWPQMGRAITNLREDCEVCRKIAPSQPAMPPTQLEVPEYPFQSVATDFFQEGNSHYFIFVCRYSNWLTVFQAKKGDSKELITQLRSYMATFGVMDEISSDGATVYTSEEVKKFLRRFGVKHRLSSAYNPHSNQRAEGGVKAAKRLIKENTGPRGDLDTDRFLAALLMHRNTPSTGTKMSPSEVVFGRQLKDLIPIVPGKLRMNPLWHDLLKMREDALAKRHLKRGKELSEHSRAMKGLKVGTTVSIQNQHGNDAKRWSKTGVVVEVGDHDKYTVKVDGSGRLTVRNRRFLRPMYKSGETSIDGKDQTLKGDETKLIRRSDRLAKKLYKEVRNA